MRIALIGAEIEENLGLRYIAAALRHAGHRVTIVPFDHGRQIASVAEHVAAGDYDLAGLSMMFQLRSREFCALIERVRAAGFAGTLVAGGQYATFMAREILTHNPGLDGVVLGEGEVPMVEVAEALSGADAREALANVPGLALRTDDGAVVTTPEREGRTDLTTLASPARDGDPRRHLGMPSAPMVASRGCYADCSFCSIVAWEKLSGGPKFRLRSPEHVADEMSALYHERGVRVFTFHDDNFWLPTIKANRERLAQLERALASRGVRDIALQLKCRPNDTDRALFEQCKSMGLVRVYVGIESDAPNGLITLRRGVSQAQNQRALDLMRELDIHACSNLLLFDPDTRLTDVPYNIGFYERNAHHTMNFCRTEPYGGTPLTRRLKDEGRLRGDWRGFDYAMREPRVELLWRIVHVAFHERNFPAEGLSNSVIGLGYRFHLAKRFWPGRELEQIRERVYDFIVRFGQSQARFLQIAHQFVSTCDVTDRDTVTMFTIDLARAIREEDARNTLECELLIRAVEQHARTRGAEGGSDGRLGEGAAGSGWYHAQPTMGVISAAAFVASTAMCHPKSGDAAPPHGAPVVSVDAGSAPSHGTTTSGVARVGSVVAHVSLSPGPGTGFGPGTESGRHHSLTSQATVEGAGSEQYEFDHAEVAPSVARVADVFITSTGRGAHFLIYPDGQTSGDTAAAVRAYFRNRSGGPAVIATAPIRVYADQRISIGTQVVPATPEYMVCDPAPAPPLLPFNTDPLVHVGPVGWNSGHSVSATFGVVQLAVWLDPSVRGTVVGQPTATTDGGQLSVTSGAGMYGSPIAADRRAIVSYDPRNPDGRLAAGRHVIVVTWSVDNSGRRQPFSVRVIATVGDDGTVTLAPEDTSPHSSAWPELPLERRFGARIVAQPDPVDPTALILRVDAPLPDRSVAYLWRASAGEIVHSAASPQAVWTVPHHEGRHLVTCAVQTDQAELAVASFAYDVS